jgi:23S rRNA (uracil1939-C5)-methyltransferase
MVGGETLCLDGRSHVRQSGIGGADFLVAGDAFFQTNVGAARELVRVVVQASGGAKRVLDLYCGSGLFAVPLAQAGASVTAVEENRQAIADLKANVRLNRLEPKRVRAIAGRVEDSLVRVSGDRWDLVILDPPREGCASEVLSAVLDRIRPQRLVYVSCNPDDLARQLPRLVKSGYGIASIQPVDMFPHTDHIETVLVLERPT